MSWPRHNPQSITQRWLTSQWKTRLTFAWKLTAMKGEKLPKIIDTGFYWYDKTNMNDPKIAAVLYD